MSAAVTPPSRLYKYQTFNVNLLRLITDAEAYYSDPRQFNDPLDCNPTIKASRSLGATQVLENQCHPRPLRAHHPPRHSPSVRLTGVETVS